MTYRILLFLFFLSILFGCTEEKVVHTFPVEEYLEASGFIPDTHLNSRIDSILPGLNGLARRFGKWRISLRPDENPTDSFQVLLVPYKPVGSVGWQSGFSDLENRMIFICPTQIQKFVTDKQLNTADLKEFIGIILLHELGHFISGTSGSFDKTDSVTANSGTGEISFGTEPEWMTYAKKQEMKVDSLAMEMVKYGMKLKPKSDSALEAYSFATGVSLTVSSAEFSLFGIRLLSQFGSSDKAIRDNSLTHPNLELRLAFMGYQLFPNPQKQEQIDEYLYNREVAPIERQSRDPRIYQGNEKVLFKESSLK